MGKLKIVGTIWEVVSAPIDNRITIYIFPIKHIYYANDFYIKDDKNNKYQFYVGSLRHARDFYTNEPIGILDGHIFRELSGRPIKLLQPSDEPCSICKYFMERYNECAPTYNVAEGLKLIL